MRCPFCKSEHTQVLDTRDSDSNNSIRRRRRCPDCDKRFTTYETVELRMPLVVKQSGQRCEFDLNKLRISLQHALHKRPVSVEQLDNTINQITQQILARGEREIPSRQIGEMVMEKLFNLDKVAYIRFSSVYKSFQDVGDFTDAVNAVNQ